MYPQRILGIEIDVGHGGIDQVVERIVHIGCNRGRILGSIIERGVLIHQRCRDVGLAVGIPVTGPRAVSKVPAVVHGRKFLAQFGRNEFQHRVPEVSKFLRIRIVVVDAVFQIKLRPLAEGFGIGQTAAETVTVRIAGNALVGHRVGDHPLRIPRQVVILFDELQLPVLAVTPVEIEGQGTPLLPELHTVQRTEPRIVSGPVAAVAAENALYRLLHIVLQFGHVGLRRLRTGIFLVAEIGAEHQVLIVIYLIVYAGIETVVVILRTGSARLVVVLAARVLPRLVHEFVPVLAVVEEIACRHLHVVTPAPRIAVIDAYGLNGRYTVHRTDKETAHASSPAAHSAAAGRTAARIDHTENILEREILLIQVVGKTDDGDTAVTLENVHVAARSIILRITVCGIEFTELPAALALRSDDIQRLVALTVVESGELRLVAQFVEYLDVLHYFGRKILYRRTHVITEKLLAVHEHLLNLFALCLHRTVRGNHDTRHLCQQALCIGIRSHLERRRVVHHRIAFLAHRTLRRTVSSDRHHLHHRAGQ